MTVIDSINREYTNFSRTRRRIADYLLANSDKACFLSLKELSEEVRVSEVTIIEFTRSVGCENFTDLKSKLQQYIGEKLSPSDKLVLAIDRLKVDDEGIREIVQKDKVMIEQTMHWLSTEKLKAAIALLKQSTRVYTAGMSISQVVTDFLALRLKDLGLEVVKFDLSSAEEIASQLMRARLTDVFIIVSFPKYAPCILALTEYLHQNQNKTICITDRLTSPIARHATVSFACPTGSSVFYNSVTAPIALSNIIVSALAVDLKDQLNPYLQRYSETVGFLQCEVPR